MNKIGFKNFRKFQEFPMLTLGNLTLLVGGNNAGKSTFVKAALLIYNFLHTQIGDITKSSIFGSVTPEMNFDVTEPFDVHIGTFARAKRRQAKDDEPIEFTFEIEGFEIAAHVNGLLINGAIDNDSASGIISYLSIKDIVNKVVYSIDYTTHRMFVEFENKDYHNTNDDNDNVSTLSEQNEKDEIEQQLKNERNFAKIIELKKRLVELNKKVTPVKANYSEEYKLELPLSDFSDSPSDYYLTNVIRSFIEYSRLDTPSTLAKNSKEYKIDVENKAVLKSNIFKMEDGKRRLSFAISLTDMEYIYAHAARQVVFFNSKDKNDYMAQTIHEFTTSKAIYDTKVQEFINTWMTEFNIGNSFKIKNHGGEAYEVFVHDTEGESNLADMGMGSIQLMILLFKLGTYMKQYGQREFPPLILIEEPEQNIHPILQSKLAELFMRLNQQMNFRFIIETHSEYLVRHCQVLAAKQLYEENISLEDVNNSIKVYYFSQERGPVDMLFMDNAKFQESFDEGFFDQAARESLIISRLERIHKRK